VPRELRILVTGGGTGGHTLPAIATIDAVRSVVKEERMDLTPVFLYVGSEAGLEVRLSEKAGVDFVAIATGKLRRMSNPVRMLSRQNVRDAFRVPLGFGQALAILRKFRPAVLFSTGGYVSIPAVFAAWMLKVPILMHEQTVQIGLANRWSAHVAQRIALSFEDAAGELSVEDRRKSFVTGSIVRDLVTTGDGSRARERYGFVADLESLPVVFVTGGAQGSSIINKAVQDALERLTSRCCIIHQCGNQTIGDAPIETALKEAAVRLPNNLASRYYVTAFVGDEISDIYALASLVVGRSGAGTVSEVCAAGKAALFIPLVPTGGDEQTKNADRLKALGAAVTLTQNELSGDRLADLVLRLVDTPDELAEMGQRAKAQYRPDAPVALARAVIALGIGAVD
jgi:UDP-N-acetylglucosamine--N-acetylmuramyl-(pentapeptide) pyrophosphoryl-undecaprenol N-acetylglucosamine transferase